MTASAIKYHQYFHDDDTDDIFINTNTCDKGVSQEAFYFYKHFAAIF